MKRVGRAGRRRGRKSQLQNGKGKKEGSKEAREEKGGVQKEKKAELSSSLIVCAL